MWFSTKSHITIVQSQVLIDETLLLQIDKQKYLVISNLTWPSNVVAVCKSMAYYLYLINYHSRSLPRKILMESLVFSRLILMLYQFGGQQYTAKNFPSRINQLHNRVVCITCGLRKSEHVSSYCQTLGWLSAPLLIQHTPCAMLDQYTMASRDILLDPPIQYGCHHTYDTRCPMHFAMIRSSM